MPKAKLTIRVEKDLFEKVKQYAAKNNTTVTDLINSYLSHISGQVSLVDAPIVRRISGSITSNVSIQDYKEHLEEKYAR